MKTLKMLLGLMVAFVAMTGICQDYNGANIAVIPILAPAQNTSASWNILKEAVEDYLAGTLGKVPARGYTLCNGKISWKDLVYASDGSSTWPVLQQLVVASSTDGSGSISLSMLRVSATSTGNALSDLYAVGSNGYSEAAVGIKADGTRITSGSPDQKVARLVFVTQMKLFSGGSTEEGLNAVKNWVLAQNNFTDTFKAFIAGDPESAGTATVSMNGYNDRPPKLVMSRNSTVITVTLTEGDPGRSYTLLATDDVVNGQWWVRIATLYPGDSLVWSEVNDQPMQFFKAVSAGY